MNQAAQGQEGARQAKRMLDKIVAEKPDKNGHDFSQAVRCLAAFRDAFLAGHRANGTTPETHAQLARLNAVISAVVGGQYPVGPIPWKHIEAAHDSYQKLLSELSLREDAS